MNDFLNMDKLLILFAIFVGCYSSSLPVFAPTIRLNDGYNIPGLALGTWLGHNIEPQGEEVVNSVTWAIDAGYRHIDTACIYKVEDQVGIALAKKFEQGLKREEVFVTTKLWNNAHARDAVVPALKKSLQDLQLDYVDLYLIHFPMGIFSNGTYDLTDYLETWRGMIDAKSLGLTRSIGLSNFNIEQMERIKEHCLETPAVLEVEVSLNIQQPALREYCRNNNITVMGYTPFGSIFYNRAQPDSPPPRVDTPELVAIADKYNKTVPQVVLRYLHELCNIPIPKSLTKSRIEENINIFDFSLSDEDKVLLKSYDKNYRKTTMRYWMDHPYYPFEKN